MNQPTVTTHRVAADTDVVATYAPLPGLGIVPIQAFVIRAREPVLVDTGPAGVQHELIAALGTSVCLDDLRWIWLTHADADHIGNLRALLDLAPRATVVTNYLGIGKMGLLGLPLDRVRMLAPGQTLDVGDRTLAALRPPVYDAPETMGLFDSRRRHLYSSDCFGALLDAPRETAEDIAAPQLRDGLQTWATIDAPWIHAVPRDWLRHALRKVQELRPEVLLSSHLPPARGAMPRLFELLEHAGARPVFVGPPVENAPAAEVAVA